MTGAEVELAQAVSFLEDQVADLRMLFLATPHDEFATRQMARTLSRLRGAAIDATALYLAANAITTDNRGASSAVD